MIGFASICDGLAARFAAATMGTPSGAPAIQRTYGARPTSLPALPAVYVAPTQGSVVAASDHWRHEMDLDAVLVLSKSPGDPATLDLWRELYLPYMLAATEGQVKLGLGAQTGWEVAKALPTGWDWDEPVIDADKFDGIRVHFRVWVNETVSLVP